ncbi:MAG: hypothetical protein U0871_06310 [Gemmataceae bacterium]
MPFTSIAPGCGATGVPGTTRISPRITTRSSGLRPAVTIRSPPLSGPSVTGRASTRSSGPTTYTTFRAWSVATASSGIRTARSLTESGTRPRTNSPGASGRTPFVCGLGKVPRICSDPVSGLSWLPANSSTPLWG